MPFKNQDVVAILGKEVASGQSSDASTDYDCVKGILIGYETITSS